MLSCGRNKPYSYIPFWLFSHSLWLVCTKSFYTFPLRFTISHYKLSFQSHRCSAVGIEDQSYRWWALPFVHAAKSEFCDCHWPGRVSWNTFRCKSRTWRVLLKHQGGRVLSQYAPTMCWLEWIRCRLVRRVETAWLDLSHLAFFMCWRDSLALRILYAWPSWSCALLRGSFSLRRWVNIEFWKCCVSSSVMKGDTKQGTINTMARQDTRL